MPVMGQFPADGPEKCGLSTSVWPQKSDHTPWCVNRKGDMIQDLPSAETEGDILNRKKISHFDSAPPFRENQIDQKRCTRSDVKILTGNSTAVRDFANTSAVSSRTLPMIPLKRQDDRLLCR